MDKYLTSAFQLATIMANKRGSRTAEITGHFEFLTVCGRSAKKRLRSRNFGALAAPNRTKPAEDAEGNVGTSAISWTSCPLWRIFDAGASIASG